MTTSFAQDATPRTCAVIGYTDEHDLAALLPIACDTCAPARGSAAQFQIGFDIIHKGELDGIRWHVCKDCLQSCLIAAAKQNRGFTPPILTVLPTRPAVAV